MKQELENSVKRFLKRKVKVTLGLMVAFMISGSIGYAESIIPKSEDTEVLLFMNGTFREFDNEEIKDIGEFRLVQGQEVIKPPVVDEPTVPDKPVDPDKPTDPDKPIDPDKPGETIPWEDLVPATKVNSENKVQENGIVFDIKENEKFVNKGEITYKSDIELNNHQDDFTWGKPSIEAYAIKNNGGNVVNEGNIKVEGLKDVNIGNSGKIIKTGEGVGVYQTSGTFINNGTITVAGNGYDYDKDGSIDFSGGTGVLIEGGKAINNSVIASPDSYLLPDKSVVLGRGIGMKALGGTIENAEGGLIKNQEYSMIAIEKGIAINNGNIETERFGITAFNGGTGINNGVIKAWVNEKEGHKGEAGIGLYASSNSGAETVITNGEKGIVYGSVRAEGTNAKIINNGTIYGTEIKVTNGVIENNGTITGEATKPVIDIEVENLFKV